MGKKKLSHNLIRMLTVYLCLFICTTCLRIVNVKGVAAESVSSDEVRGLYVRADTASLELDDEDIEKYKEYVKALKEGINSEIPLEGINAFEKIVGLIDATRFNAVVIDVKDDMGNVAIPSDSQYILTAGSYNYQLKNIEGTIEQLKKYGIYVIARIVVFKDDVLANNISHSIRYDDGTVWKDYSGSAWVDPYDEWVRQYNIEVAKEAALAGFDEIQFDYIRFPEKFSQYEVSSKYLENRIRPDELIRQFLKDAYSQLQLYDIKVSADIFGCVAHLWDDQLNIDIGQVWYNLTQEVDYISPMVYPSHYRGTNWYTAGDPNKHPYEIVKGAIEDSLRINSAFEDKAGIRLWLQGFTIYEYEYGPVQILDQVRALHEKGIDTYIFWNNKNIYDPADYIVLENQDIEEKQGIYHVHDISMNNPSDAAKKYLAADMNKDLFISFILKTTKTRSDEYMDYCNNIHWEGITGYELTGYRSSFNTSQVFFNIKKDSIEHRTKIG